MKIRPATIKDTPEIVNLLRLCMGESLMPKSVAYWNWKHIHNPFGISFILVAEEDGKIIGVRAFMQWKWRCGNEQLRASRPVDTATHPDHRRQGIFTKITLGLLEKCQQEKIEIIFNTPNKKSKLGNKKLGWEEAGRLPVNVSIKRPAEVLMSKLLLKSNTKFIKMFNSEYSLAKALDSFTLTERRENYWHTAYSKQYLKWRYLDIPVISYYGHYNNDALVIFRLKRGSLGVELRICESFGLLRSVRQLLNDLYNTCSFDYMTHNGFSPISLPGLFKQRLGIGPDVTMRRVMKEDVSEFKNFSFWHPSLGDLEVF